MRVGKYVNIKCSNCNVKVAVPMLKLLAFSLYSQITGVFGFFAFISLIPRPFSITTTSIVGVIGYVIDVAPAVIFYIKTTELVTKSA